MLENPFLPEPPFNNEPVFYGPFRRQLDGEKRKKLTLEWIRVVAGLNIQMAYYLFCLLGSEYARQYNQKNAKLLFPMLGKAFEAEIVSPNANNKLTGERLEFVNLYEPPRRAHLVPMQPIVLPYLNEFERRTRGEQGESTSTRIGTATGGYQWLLDNAGETYRRKPSIKLNDPWLPATILYQTLMGFPEEMRLATPIQILYDTRKRPNYSRLIALENRIYSWWLNWQKLEEVGRRGGHKIQQPSNPELQNPKLGMAVARIGHARLSDFPINGYCFPVSDFLRNHQSLHFSARFTRRRMTIRDEVVELMSPNEKNSEEVYYRTGDSRTIWKQLYLVFFGDFI